MPPPRRLFVSYSHEDEKHRRRLATELRPLERDGLVEVWHDRRILPGDDWKGKIAERLETADLILFLVSPDLLASDYVHDVEARRALERHQAGEARVVPVLVRPTENWRSSPLAGIQVLPSDARPVTDWPSKDRAWADVVKGLRELLGTEAGGGPDPARASTGARQRVREVDPRPYLETLREKNRWLEIRGMGAQVAERMELTDVYTRLRAAGGAPREARVAGRRDDMEPRDRDLREVLTEHRDVVLIGDPGSGKTTHLRYLAQNLAALCLDPGDAKARERLGLGDDPAPQFPVLVRLAEFAKSLGARKSSDLPEAAREHFLAYLDAVVVGDGLRLPERWLRDRIERGGCLVLLDGLDEVPGAGERERIARIVEEVVVAGRRAGNRHWITCRTRAYEGRVQLAGDLENFRLAPFDREQVEAFAAGWCRALHRVPEDDTSSPAAGLAEGYSSELLEAIDSHPNVGPLTESPLMLTVLAVVHWNRRRLPEGRADLYGAAVEYLLESRREQSSYSTTRRREALRALAVRMMDDPDGVQRTLGREEAAVAVARALGIDRRAAMEFLEEEALWSGLLVSRTEGEVEFWHLTFQEYLAAVELAEDFDEGWRRLAPRLHDDRWSEVVLLLAGALRAAGIKSARRLIEKVLDTGTERESRARAVGLAGRILGELRSAGGSPEKDTRYEEALRATLEIFEPGGPVVEERVRIEVGEALGRAGDPRLAGVRDNKILIRGGAFWMGAQARDPRGRGHDPDAFEDEAPVHRVALSDFRIGRFPVTVGEFRRFVEAGARGCLDRANWSPQGWKWRQAASVEAPENWKDQLLHPTRPVTGVSWHEADAYARWAGGDLPTEAQWEYTARGDVGRKYPWGGDEPTNRHASFGSTVRASPPVGIYPLGATPEGVHDLAGNVWEWCRDWFGRYEDQETHNPIGPKSGQSRVLRGGSWAYIPGDLRASIRGYSRPENRFGYVGFRVVWSAAGGRE